MVQLNYRNVRPIYEQIRDGLYHLVITGMPQAGDKLPSVRALASSLAIDPNTIQRAHEPLEQEGYLYTVAGKSFFTAPQAGVNTARKDRLLREFDASMTELLFLDMVAEELVGRLGAATQQTVREERDYN